MCSRFSCLGCGSLGPKSEPPALSLWNRHLSRLVVYIPEKYLSLWWTAMWLFQQQPATSPSALRSLRKLQGLHREWVTQSIFVESCLDKPLIPEFTRTGLALFHHQNDSRIHQNSTRIIPKNKKKPLKHLIWNHVRTPESFETSFPNAG